MLVQSRYFNPSLFVLSSYLILGCLLVLIYMRRLSGRFHVVLCCKSLVDCQRIEGEDGWR